MENAGGAVYQVISRGQEVSGRRFLIISGPGNNGGDGFVAARRLHASGGDVRVLVYGDPASHAGPARVNLEILGKSGIETFFRPTADELSAALAWCHLVVDGLLGTGIEREVNGLFRDAVQEVNDSRKPVVSIDIPSGVDGNTGQVQGAAIRAGRTVTFGLPKRGNLIGPGAELGGQLFLSHISFPPELVASAGIEVAINEPAPLPSSLGEDVAKPAEDVLFVAGGQNPVDSTAFASMALTEIGGNPSRLAIPCSLVSSVEGIAGRVVLLPQAETGTGTLALDALEDLVDLGRSARLVVLEPGRSPSRETGELIRRFCEHLQTPLLLDGDVLLGGNGDLGAIRHRTSPTILVLRPTEMSHLIEPTLAEIERDPLGCTQDLAEDLRAIVVLRGRPTLIGMPDRSVFVDLIDRFLGFHTGWCNVLPGVIGAIWGLGLTPEEAVRTAVFLHGLAGDLAAQKDGEAGVTSRQIVERMPEAFQALRDDFRRVTAHYPGAIEVIG
jgi:NAD(P)H-hydrate epimerase